MKKYYYSDNGTSIGPYTIEQLKNLGANKDSLIWCEDFTDWKKVSEIPELADLFHEPQNKLPQFQSKRTFPVTPVILGLIFIVCIGGYFLYIQIINPSKTSMPENTEQISRTEDSEPYESSPNKKMVDGIYPQASQRILNSSDISGLDADDLKIMRNEIFARHGYIFETSDMKAYFERQTWYQGRFQNIESKLTPIERNNIQLIKNQENLFNPSGDPNNQTTIESEYSQTFVSRNYEGNGIIEILECTFSSSDVFQKVVYKTSKGKRIELQILLADENYLKFQFPNSSQIFTLEKNENRITCIDPDNQEQYFLRE
jgi:hypothetical protein